MDERYRSSVTITYAADLTVKDAADLTVKRDRSDSLQYRGGNPGGVDAVLAPGDALLDVPEMFGFGTHIHSGVLGSWSRLSQQSCDTQKASPHRSTAASEPLALRL